MSKNYGFLIGLLFSFLLFGPVSAGDLRREKVKKIYSAQVGTREKTGKNDGVKVEAFLRYVGLRAGSPWCAAFVCWTLGEAGVKNPKSGWSPSMFPKSSVIWSQSLKTTRKPQPGDVFGLWFANLGRIAHVGFVDSWDDGNYAITVEGNTNDGGSREGDGVYRKRRLKRQIHAVSTFLN